MSKTLKIILAIATLLSTLTVLGFGVYGLVLPHAGLAVCCFALTILFGFFVRNDYYYFFGKKPASDPTKGKDSK